MTMPLLRWVKRWGISVFSLSLGLAALFVFRRGLPHVGWIVGYLLLLWLLIVLVAELRAPLESKRQRLGVVAGALITAIDPWYAAIVHPRPWLNQILLGFSIFAALNVALPLVRIKPI